MKRYVIGLFLALTTSIAAFAETTSDTIELKVTGKITYKSGNVVKMQKISGDEFPDAGIEGELSKSFESEIFGGKMTGWMSIGKMKVTAVSKDIITFALLKELSVITENGVKKNNFEIGKEVKFVWKIAVAADEAAFQKGQDLVEDDIDEALKYYKEAISLNPEHHEALNMVGMVMDQKGNQDSALFYFEKAHVLAPDVLRYCRNSLIMAYKVGEYDKAFEYSKKAIELEKEEASLWYYRALMRYASRKDEMTDEDGAAILEDMNKAIELAPEKAMYFSERAFFKYEQGDAEGACTDARKAKSLGAQNADESINTYCSE